MKTCRQFLPLSLSRLSSASMISMKSTLRTGECELLALSVSRKRVRAHLLYDILAISFMSRVLGGSGSLLVDDLTFFCVGEYPLVTFLQALADLRAIPPPTTMAGERSEMVVEGRGCL